MSTDDLTSAFGVPATAQTAQLSGRLAKRSTASEQPAPAAEPAPTPEPAEAPAPASAPPAAAAAAPPAAAEEDGTPTQVSVYLTAAAVAAVRRVKGRHTNADVALDAIDATIDQLPALLTARRTTDRPGSLFPARRRAHRGAYSNDPPRVLWSMKATPAELAVLDRLVGQVGASSRSELIATAIEAHLTRPRRRQR